MEISASWVFRDLPIGPQFSVLSPNPLCLGPAGPSSPSGHCRGNAHTPASSVHNLSRRNSRFSSCAPHSCSPGREVYAQWGSCCRKHPAEKHSGGKYTRLLGSGDGDLQGWHMYTTPSFFVPLAWEGGGLPAVATLWAAFPFSI